MMKKTPEPCRRRRLLLLVPLLLAVPVHAAQNRDARVTQIVRDVRVLPPHAAARAAAINETVANGTGVRTGSDSRAELTFTDLSITRLGANTIFSFDQANRNLSLTSGAVLICVPPEAGSVRISTPAVSAAITGGIAMVEAHRNAWIKIIVLEGRGVITLKRSGRMLTLHAGEMIVLSPGAKEFGTVQNIDLDKLTNNSLLIRFARLPSWVARLIDTQIANQQSSPPPGGLVDPTGFDAIDQRAAVLSQSTPPARRTGPQPSPPRRPPGTK
jgi:hypothetical protein